MCNNYTGSPKSSPKFSTDILSWNCNGVFHHYEDLLYLLNIYKPAVLCLQESHLKTNQKFDLQGYKTFSITPQHNITAHGGVITAVRNSTHTIPIQLSSNIQAIAIQVYLQQQPVAICNIYLPPDSTTTGEDLDSLISKLPKPYILVGFNAHNNLWVSHITNRHGKILEAIIDRRTLSILNTEPTHYNFSYKRWSLLDFIITSPTQTSNLQVLYHSDLAGSDHIPLAVTGLQLPHTTITVPTQQTFKKTSWPDYHNLCSREFQPILPSNDINYDIEQLTSSLTHLALQCTPPQPTHRRNQRTLVPWWNDDCTAALCERRRALRRLKGNSTLENHNHFRKCRAKAKFVIKNAKRESWRQYTSSITSQTPITQIWKKIRALDRKTSFSLPQAILDNTQLITNPRDIAEAFATHFSSASNNQISPPSSYHPSKDLTDDTDYNSDLTLHELHQALKNMRISAPGHDGFHINLLKHAPEKIIENVLSLFNHIWKKGYFPSS